MWDMAVPDEENTMISEAIFRSLAELAAEENTMINEAASKSLRENNGGTDEIQQILVMGLNKHPIEFTSAISESTLARSLSMRGVNISPDCANGAKILMEGLTPEMVEKRRSTFRS